LDRRKFLSLSSVGIAAATGGAAAEADATSRERLAPPLLAKLGCQSGPSTDEHFAFLSRYGIKNVVANPNQTDHARAYATVEEMRALVALAGKYGLAVDMTDCNFMTSATPSAIMLGSPGREKEISDFQALIRNCAETGIPALKYNLPIMPILRSAVIPGRGDSLNHRWRIREMQSSPLMTIWDGGPNGESHDRPIDKVSGFEQTIGKPSAEVIWERIEFFLARVVPTAAQYKVRLALHPEDCGVPPEGFHGVPQVLGTVEGLKRFVTMHESPYHGLAFCQGTISEDLSDPSTQIYDVIRWFGERKKIFLVHFRNVRGHRDDVVVEIFPDEGSVDMVRALHIYREVGYDGMLVPDHVPFGSVASRSENFAYCYGYIKGLLQSAAQGIPA
jgi:mannonate dehydratase